MNPRAHNRPFTTISVILLKPRDLYVSLILTYLPFYLLHTVEGCNFSKKSSLRYFFVSVIYLFQRPLACVLPCSYFPLFRYFESILLFSRHAPAISVCSKSQRSLSRLCLAIVNSLLTSLYS